MIVFFCDLYYYGYKSHRMRIRIAPETLHQLTADEGLGTLD